MARDTWQVKRPSVVTDKIKKSLIIPAFSHRCGYDLSSIYKSTSFPNAVLTEVSEQCRETFTLEAWVKVQPTDENSTLFTMYDDNAPEKQFKVEIVNGALKVTLYNLAGSSLVLESDNNIPFGKWFHIALVYNGSTAYLYLNGIRADFGPLTGPLKYLGGHPVGGSFSLYMWSDNLFDNITIAKMAQIRMYHFARRAEDVILFYDKLLPEGGGYEEMNVNTIGATEGATLVESNGLDFPVADGFELDEEDVPPVGYGAPFVVVEYPTSLGKQVSLKFPVIPPEDVNFGLFVSFTDEDGIFRRYRLFAPDGMEVAPNVTNYNGEPLDDGFKLEVFNTDGNVSVDLDDDFTLYISDTTNPTTGIDQTSIEAEDLVADITLAEPFDLTNFPLEFNTQQTY